MNATRPIDLLTWPAPHRARRASRAGALLLATAAAFDCSPAPPSGDAAATIDAAGGVARAMSGPVAGASVAVPAGAVETPTRVTLAPGGAADGLPQGLDAVGPVVLLGPEGQTFATPVTVTLPTTAEATVLLTRPAAGGAWSVVPGARFDVATRTIRGEVAHFSMFVPGAPRDRPAPSPCALGETLCGRACVRLADDPLHCGACDNACAAGTACLAGVCAACAPRAEVCNGRDDNCDGRVDEGGVCAMDGGATGDAGPRLDAASADDAATPSDAHPGDDGDAAAAMTCAPHLAPCGDRCLALGTDPANCGACGRACFPGWACDGGLCVVEPRPHLFPECSLDEVVCGTYLSQFCMEITAAQNGACNGCPGACNFPGHEAGTCDAHTGLCTGSHPCSAGQTACFSYCVDLASSDADCGECGHGCAGGEHCAAGVCAR